jgi:lysyl-tRNA synthetase, class II
VSDIPDNNFEQVRADKLRKIEELGLDPWGQRFDGHQPIGEIRKLPCDDHPPTTRVRAAGRIVQRRGQGKAVFIDIRDWTGKIQIHIGQKQVGDQDWALTQLLDLGDLIGVDGLFGKTRMGEPTIFVDKLTYLSKSLLPHPDKWGGMADIEFRLRHRYLDLIYSPETLERALKRVQVVRCIRTHLDAKGYMEVEGPTLHAIAGGAAAQPFITHHNALDIDLYLRIALELHLKRLLVGGVEKVYEIGRVFRNEGISQKHNPEFTMLELYQAYGNYETMMELTEGLVLACIDAIGGEKKRPCGERTIDFSPPWDKKTYGELFQQCVGTAFDDRAGVAAAAQVIGLNVQNMDHDVRVHKLFEVKVEPYLETLDRPVFVHDYPAGLCPLTKRKKGNPGIAERFELYVLGMELANAYTELNDPITQERTFRQQLAGLPEEDSMAKMDADFVRALKHGMPPAGGLGVGIDRLAMLLTNTTTIRDVILFPLLRPEK